MTAAESPQHFHSQNVLSAPHTPQDNCSEYFLERFFRAFFSSIDGENQPSCRYPTWDIQMWFVFNSPTSLMRPEAISSGSSAWMFLIELWTSSSMWSTPTTLPLLPVCAQERGRQLLREPNEWSVHTTKEQADLIWTFTILAKQAVR